MGQGNRILLSRFLTRAGDQAWDFAVPLVLLMLFPGNIRVAALYYLAIKLSSLFVLPTLSKKIDNLARLSLFKIGIGSQTLGLLLGWISLLSIELYRLNDLSLSSTWAVFVVVMACGVISNLGASLMEISVGMDLAVDIIPPNELSLFNSRLKFLELVTEVGIPVLAGLVLVLKPVSFPLMGFSVVAIWNLLSFIPEYLLLRSTIQVVQRRKEGVFVIGDGKPNIFTEFYLGVRSFSGAIYAVPVLCYALLWLSVLSPHGVLLTAFLKGSWQVSEITMGVFRGLGALFGVMATFLFPRINQTYTLFKISLWFLGSQALSVALSLVFFRMGGNVGQYGFLFFILLSRVGLYGFSLGETEIRQRLIPASQRGAANGFAHALTNLATIGLFAAGAFLPSVDDFAYLVNASVFFVGLSFILYLRWYPRAALIR